MLTTLRILAVYLYMKASIASRLPHDLPARQRNWTVGQTVQTSSGPVEGHAATTSGVSAYLGIPYAQPPIGKLRFEVPVKYTGRNTINGTSFAFICTQTDPFAVLGDQLQEDGQLDRSATQGLPTAAGIALLLAYSSGTPAQSEDCLTLNVWTKPQTGEAKKAVMIWIHGGGFTSGSSAVSFYNGKHLAELEDVVVVSMNYRLNIFGFPGDPTGDSINLGLLDQRLAIEWVRDNIEAFGGDASRIIIFGQSAGGSSVTYHQYAWPSNPIVSGYIPQSGYVGSEYSNATAAEYWKNATIAAGCASETAIVDPALVTACMKAKSPSVVFSASSGLSFIPAIDEKMVFSDYAARTPAALPLLVGNNDFEPGLFVVFAPDTPAKQLQAAELGFDCPAAQQAAYNIKAGNPTWRYRWFGDFPNMRLTNNPPSGAWHGSELPPLFDTVPQIPVTNTAAENSILDYLRGAWAAFAKNPVNGLASFDSWPGYNSSGETLIRLAYNNQTGTNLAKGDAYDEGC